MPPLKTVRHRTALVLLLLAALVATLPGMTIAGSAPDVPAIHRRPEKDDDKEGDSDKAEDADSDKDAKSDKKDDDADADDADSDSDKDDDDSDAKPKTVDDLPDWAQKLVKNARRAERDAKRKMRAATKGEKPKPKTKDDDDKDGDKPTAPDAGTLKLRQVNLRSALEKKGYPGPRAAAVSRLLDDVEFDEKDKPLDLDDALEDAIEEYGDEIAGKGEKPKPKRRKVDTNGRDGNRGGNPPKLSAEELAVAEKAGKTPEQWAAWKGVTNIDQAVALLKKDRDKK